MKKLLKSSCLVLAIISMVICFTACGNKPKAKTFTCSAGLSITLTDEFYEKSIVSQTFYLESTDSLFTALKETFTTLELVHNNPSQMTKSEYATLVKNNNNLTVEIVDDTVNDLVYFTYNKNVSGKDFFYLSVVEKGTDAFWLCQFACEQDNESKFTSQFIEWAKTITVI